MNEFERISYFLKPLSNQNGLYLEDDASYFDQLVITTDTIAQGIHFFGNESGEDIAYKLMGVNMSDLLAKGASPFGYFLNITGYFSDLWMQEFSQTMHTLQNYYNCKLLGGDTVNASLQVLSMTLIGKSKYIIPRSGARPGDLICLSGPIGDSWIGLQSINNARIKDRSYFINKYKRPIPLFPIQHNKATASIDVSDGLITDLRKLLSASHVGANIYLEDVWVSDPAKELLKKNIFSIKDLVIGGDDYQILWTCKPKDSPKTGVFGEIIDEKYKLQIWHKNKICTFTKEGYIHEWNKT